MLAHLADKVGIKSPTLQRLQNQLIKSLNFRLLAVYLVYNTKGNKIPEACKMRLNAVNCRCNAVEILEDLIAYKVPKIRSIYRNQLGGKKKLVKISSLLDRCVQQLFRLVIEPVTETKADPHSFGFRPGRNAHQALAVVREHLNNSTNVENFHILDMSIRKQLKSLSKS